MGEADRRRVLLDLLAGAGDPRDLERALTGFSWDIDEPLVTLAPAHVVAVLSRFVAREVDGVWVRAWAEAIESREDIAFEPSVADQLTAVIFEFANPELHGTLDETRARELLDGGLPWTGGLQ